MMEIPKVKANDIQIIRLESPSHGSHSTYPRVPNTRCHERVILGSAAHVKDIPESENSLVTSVYPRDSPQAVSSSSPLFLFLGGGCRPRADQD